MLYKCSYLLTYLLAACGLLACFGSVTIDRQRGIVRLARQLDYSEVQSLDYVLQATDGANGSTTATLRINVLDSDSQGPTFNRDQYSAFVPELQSSLVPAITVYVRTPVLIRLTGTETEKRN